MDGVIHGQGVLKMEMGKGEFRGTFKKGLKVKGKLKTAKGIYEGPFHNGVM